MSTPTPTAQTPTSPKKERESPTKLTGLECASSNLSETVSRVPYRKLKSSFEEFQTAKTINHSRSIPDLSALVEVNKNEEDASSSSLENLYNSYSSKTQPEKRSSASIHKRRKQPVSTAIITPIPTKLSPVKSAEDPVYISSASVPLHNLIQRSTQSMIRDSNSNSTDR